MFDKNFSFSGLLFLPAGARPKDYIKRLLSISEPFACAACVLCCAVGITTSLSSLLAREWKPITHVQTGRNFHLRRARIGSFHNPLGVVYSDWMNARGENTSLGIGFISGFIFFIDPHEGYKAAENGSIDIDSIRERIEYSKNSFLCWQ